MRLLRRFFRRETGSFSVETAIIFPILLWGFGAMFVFWDAFKLKNNAISATYTVADLVSRQTAPITPGFVGGLDDVFTKIAGNRLENQVRVTVVRMAVGPDPVNDPTELQLIWSHGTDSLPAVTDAAQIEGLMPLMAVGASMIMVETRVEWASPLGMFLPELTFGNRVFTSPRFVPQITFDDGTGIGGGGSNLDDGLGT